MTEEKLFAQLGGFAMWEYRVINLIEVPVKSTFQDVLNAAGREGWELVGVTSQAAFLKRPTASEASQGTVTVRRSARA